MTLSLPSLELPGILLLGAICFVVGLAVGSAMTACVGEWRQLRTKRG